MKLPGSAPRGGEGAGLKVKLQLGGGGGRGPASDAQARQLGTAAKVQRHSHGSTLRSWLPLCKLVCTTAACTIRQQAVDAAGSPLRDHDGAAVGHAAQVLKKFLRRESAAPFAEPVPPELVPGYAEAIARPSDLGTVLATLQREQYPTLGAPRRPATRPAVAGQPVVLCAFKLAGMQGAGVCPSILLWVVHTRQPAS